jgi:hypothetical protein
VIGGGVTMGLRISSAIDINNGPEDFLDRDPGAHSLEALRKLSLELRFE